MITIYKYVLTPSNNYLSLPEGATPLSVDFQGEDLCMWVRLDTSKPYKNRMFIAVPTGGVDFYLDEKSKFVGTAKIDAMVFHVFENLSGL